MPAALLTPQPPAVYRNARYEQRLLAMEQRMADLMWGVAELAQLQGKLGTLVQQMLLEMQDNGFDMPGESSRQAH